MISIPFSKALEGFFLSAQSRKLSPHTIEDYENTLITKFLSFLDGDPLVDAITPEMIEQFLAAQTVSKKTTLNYHTALSAFWTWAKTHKIAREHVVSQVTPPKPEQTEILPYSEQDVRSMLNHLDRTKVYRRAGKRPASNTARNPERNRAILLLLIDTGIRAEELCNIKIHDFDQRNHRIYIFGKGAKERHVTISARTHQSIWRYLAQRPDATRADQYLFLLETGKPFKRRRLLHLVQNISGRAGVQHANVHRFRHTFAIQYLRNGGDPYTLQRLLGHSTLDMVKRYLSIVQADIEKAHQRASPVDNWAL